MMEKIKAKGLTQEVLMYLSDKDGDFYIPHKLKHDFIDEQFTDAAISLGESKEYELWINHPEGMMKNSERYHLRKNLEQKRPLDPQIERLGDSDNVFELLEMYQKLTAPKRSKSSHTEITILRFNCGSMPKGWVEFPHNFRGDYMWQLEAADKMNEDWHSEDVNKYIVDSIKENKVLKLKFYSDLSEGYNHTDIVIKQTICYG